jgi:hypothetical protein
MSEVKQATTKTYQFQVSQGLDDKIQHHFLKFSRRILQTPNSLLEGHIASRSTGTTRGDKDCHHLVKMPSLDATVYNKQVN